MESSRNKVGLKPGGTFQRSLINRRESSGVCIVWWASAPLSYWKPCLQKSKYCQLLKIEGKHDMGCPTPTPRPRPIARLPIVQFPRDFTGSWRRCMSKNFLNFIEIRPSMQECQLKYLPKQSVQQESLPTSGPIARPPVVWFILYFDESRLSTCWLIAVCTI